MPSPRSLILALYTHWDIVERLVMLGREFPAFDQEQVVTVIGACSSGKERDHCEATLRQLVSTELLQWMPRGSSLQIHPLVVEFVRGLTREHELGLSAVLKARIDAIKAATERLRAALQSRDADALRQAANQLSELFRQISQQLDHDRHAILELVERAKSKDANLPIARRYSEVLAAYDEYVAPMAEMMDSGPSGTFYRHLEAAEHELDHAVEVLTIQGALYTQRLSMRHVAFQAKELRRLGREVLKHCSDSLLPLRDEIRQHNALSASISAILGQVRKRGLHAALNGAGLPLWRRDMPRRVTVGSEVLTIMAQARNYQPVSIAFPDDHGADAAAMEVELIDESTVLAALSQSLPVPDLLAWLKAQYPHASDTTILRLHHMLLEHPGWTVHAAEQPQRQPLTTVYVTHYPHALTKTAGSSREQSF